MNLTELLTLVKEKNILITIKPCHGGIQIDMAPLASEENLRGAYEMVRVDLALLEEQSLKGTDTIVGPQIKKAVLNFNFS